MIATRARTRTFTTILLFSLLAATALLGTTSGLPSSPYGYNDDDDDDPSEFSSLDQSSPCSLEDAKLPNCASRDSCLSGPPLGSNVVAVALGIGTQNYTCSSESATPTPNGALATLYDISCTVATVPSAAHCLGALALKADVHSGDPPIPPGMGYKEIGTHYFLPDAKTAIFKFDLNNKSFEFAGGRLENIPAPYDAVTGTVDWLKLGRTPGLDESQGYNVKWVYRVFTAGGKAPGTCAGQQRELTVDYVTEYWFYN